ncbi:hypothetical protein C493_07199 [Natronolimnohabitans innermongolicus JCM 12255]|uniref:Uncharacterized protein n=1 Tax=Natronolimnohabitans innermongolicus JCM 12255 TaxID=1227499 RepID=L9XCJ4_9EURY|nr:hypothetical protein C493_07199 [Natronolimnohabitans innermongolicus JCM 12255]
MKFFEILEMTTASFSLPVGKLDRSIINVCTGFDLDVSSVTVGYFGNRHFLSRQICGFDFPASIHLDLKRVSLKHISWESIQHEVDDTHLRAVRINIPSNVDSWTISSYILKTICTLQEKASASTSTEITDEKRVVRGSITDFVLIWKRYFSHCTTN